MTIHLQTVATIGKTFSVKRETDDDDADIVIARLKLTEVFVDRDAIDEILAQPIGWSSTALFHDQGEPRAKMTLTVHRMEWQATGTIAGGMATMSDPRLKIKDADVEALTLELTKLGAVMSCTLSWTAAGDEVDDIGDMLGKVCTFDAVLTDSGQSDLFVKAKAA